MTKPFTGFLAVIIVLYLQGCCGFANVGLNPAHNLDASIVYSTDGLYGSKIHEGYLNEVYLGTEIGDYRKFAEFGYGYREECLLFFELAEFYYCVPNANSETVNRNPDVYSPDFSLISLRKIDYQFRDLEHAWRIQFTRKKEPSVTYHIIYSCKYGVVSLYIPPVKELGDVSGLEYVLAPNHLLFSELGIGAGKCDKLPL